MAKFDELTTAIAALEAQVTDTEGTTDSAVALIEGFAASIQTAVDAALVADNAADDASVVAANAAIAAVTERYKASADKLGVAVASNNPTPPEQPEFPV